MLTKFKNCMSCKRWVEISGQIGSVFIAPQIASAESEADEDGSALFWKKLAHQATFGDLGGKSGGKFKFDRHSSGYDSDERSD